MTDPNRINLDDEDLGTLAHSALQEALIGMNRLSDLEVVAYAGNSVHIEGTQAPLSGEGLLTRIDRERLILTLDLLGSIALSLRETVELLDGVARRVPPAAEASVTLYRCPDTSAHPAHQCPGRTETSPTAPTTVRPVRDAPRA